MGVQGKEHGSAEAEHRYTESLLERAAGEGDRFVHVWRPHRQVAFGRRDLALTGYSDAVAVAERHGLPATVRTVGGRAVVHTGGSAAFAVAEPVEDMAGGLRERYRGVTGAVRSGLGELTGAEIECGLLERSFCPGEHSLSIGGRKVGGVAQRLRRDAALVSGVVLVSDRETTVSVLEDVYAALDLEFDPSTVGCLENQGVDDVDGVLDALESCLREG